MNPQPGWFKRECDSVHAEVAAWPKWMREAAGIERPPLILPSAADVAKFAPPVEPEDDFLTENGKGLPIVRHPVGLKE